MVATDWHALYPKAPADLVPAGYAISGVFDLTPLLGLPINQDLRLDAEGARRVSPLLWPVPSGRSSTPRSATSKPASSNARAVRWRMPGGRQKRKRATRNSRHNHFTVIDALTDPDSAMTARVAELALRLNR